MLYLAVLFGEENDETEIRIAARHLVWYSIEVAPVRNRTFPGTHDKALVSKIRN